MNNHDEENQQLTGKERANIVDPSLTVNSRILFIRKVYSILTVQMLSTTILTYLAYIFVGFRDFLIQYYILCFPVFIIIFSIEIALICYRSCARKTPRNYILLGVFTLGFSYIVASICSVYMVQYVNGGQLILMAMAMTFGMTFALTLYAFTTKEDFTTCGLFLFICGICLFFFGIFMIFTNNPMIHILYCVVSILFYSLYIIMDTQLIMGSKQYELSMDDYIVGALILYIDIILLFLKLLQLLAIIFGKK